MKHTISVVFVLLLTTSPYTSSVNISYRVITTSLDHHQYHYTKSSHKNRETNLINTSIHDTLKTNGLSFQTRLGILRAPAVVHAVATLRRMPVELAIDQLAPPHPLNLLPNTKFLGPILALPKQYSLKELAKRLKLSRIYNSSSQILNNRR